MAQLAPVLPSQADPTASLCSGVTACSSGTLQEFLCQVTAVQVEIPTLEGTARGLNPIHPDLWRILHHFPRALDVAGLRRDLALVGGCHPSIYVFRRWHTMFHSCVPHSRDVVCSWLSLDRIILMAFALLYAASGLCTAGTCRIVSVSVQAMRNINIIFRESLAVRLRRGWARCGRLCTGRVAPLAI